LTYIPLFFDPKGFRVLVFGGGEVGSRRARMFAEAGAHVSIIALEFSERAKELSQKGMAELVRLDVLREHDRVEALIDKADIVVIATGNPRVDNEVYEMASRKGKLINNATDSSKGNVIVPFMGEVGGFHIAVTTLGKSSIAAKHALRRLIKTLENDKQLQALLHSLSRIKEELKSTINDPRKRMDIYKAIENDEKFWSMINQGDPDKAYKRARQLLNTYKRVEGQ